MISSKMIFAGLAVILVFVVAFVMFRQKPKAIQQDTELGRETAKADSQNVNEDLKEQDVQEAQQEGNVDNKSLSKPEMIIDSSKSYSAVLHTAEGDITIELNVSATPITANNFVYLSRQGFYNGTIFHRVMAGFMIQGGDPTGTGTGSPGYRFDDEPFSGEYTRGVVAMANSGPNTNGSQFFIMHADYPLPPNYVIFGRVAEGMETVDKIATAQTTISAGGEKSKPVSPVAVDSVDIIEQ